MHYGLTIFPTDYSIPLHELAVEAESRGIESLWVAEHSHIPVEGASPYPGGGELPKMYYDTLDPFVALATAAVVTSTIKLGTAICLVVQRDPIHTAKLVASLDQVSQGRFLFGVGAGWNLKEIENHGDDPDVRFGLLRERIEAMKAIWGNSKGEYHGERVDFDPIYMWPKPIQKPHPPIHVGGGFPGSVQRAVRYGDGWMPIASPGDRVEEGLAEMRRLAEEAERDPASLEVSVCGIVAKEKVAERYQELGANRVIFGLPPAARDDILPGLDRCAEIMNKVG